ncbi:MAG: DUF262 domain-containing protein [Nitrososphaerota archaeon]|jgi:hypothetical protein|nr:DUF262 domain-containing protein [Nitrososphaerota archaeon]MDG7039163.1 DUF262 domain-containing protein [Nitrososphaerota archaeon]MDG7040736.1 DUF262 domain-containing protein [Nitrososphaerota archaeon]
MNIETISCSRTQFKISYLKELHDNGKIKYNVEYQRTFIWNESKRQKLIDSILRGYDISQIVLKQDGDGFEVLDGQQRLTSIFKYLNNDFSLSLEFTPEVGKKRFTELEEEYRYKVKYFQINAIVIYKADDETTSDIFLRLQEGVPLNSAEKLNATRGAIRNKIVELSKHHLLLNTGVSPYRFAYRLMCAQVVRLVLEYPNIVDTRRGNLMQMYTTYKKQLPPDSKLGIVTDEFNFLNRIFGKDARLIVNRGDFITIFLLAHHLRSKYVLGSNDKKIKEFVREFLTMVEKELSSEHRNEVVPNNPYYRYALARKSLADSRKSIEERLDIMLYKFLEYVPNLQLKDNMREFDRHQKLAIYYRDGGKCKMCMEDAQEIPFDKVWFDHIIPWSKGGPTTVENGQVLCEEHNRQKGGG